MTERNLLACSSMGWAHTADSVPWPAECGHLVWISPEGVSDAARLDLRVMCTDCIDPDLVGGAQLTPEIRAAMIRELGLTATMRLLQLANNKQFQRRHFGRNLRRDN